MFVQVTQSNGEISKNLCFYYLFLIDWFQNVPQTDGNTRRHRNAKR